MAAASNPTISPVGIHILFHAITSCFFKFAGLRSPAVVINLSSKSLGNFEEPGTLWPITPTRTPSTGISYGLAKAT